VEKKILKYMIGFFGGMAGLSLLVIDMNPMQFFVVFVSSTFVVVGGIILFNIEDVKELIIDGRRDSKRDNKKT